MALTGEAKTNYQREYMRRRREAERGAGKHARKGHTAANVAPAHNAKSQTEPREVRRLQAEVGRLRELLAKAEAKAATVPPAERDRQMESLKTRNRTLQHQVRHMTEWVEKEKEKLASAKKLYVMPEATYKAIVKCLHPDERLKRTPKQIDDACGLLTQWKAEMEKRQRKS